MAISALLGEFNAYLDRSHADPIADAVGFRQHAPWLSPHERDELIGELRRAMMPQLNNEPAPGRRQHLISPILFPIDDPPPQTPSQWVQQRPPDAWIAWNGAFIAQL